MVATFTQTVKRRAAEELRKLSPREQALLLLAVLGVLAYFFFQLTSAVRQRFADQAAELEKIEAMRHEVLGSSEGDRSPGALQRYLELKSRKGALEAQFKDADIKEGERSYIENLLRTKAGVSERYDIKDEPLKDFGTDYQLAPFTVRFTAMSLKGNIDFLRELTNGPHPLVITELDARKGQVGDKVNITIGLLSIHKVK
jgi:hypothetical protein